MTGIWPMAAITLAVGTLACLGYLRLKARPARRFIWLLFLGLPLSFLINRLVKGPLVNFAAGAAGIAPGLGLTTPLWFLLFTWWLSPLTEELVKLLPLAVPQARRFLAQPGDALIAGLALGMSFGLGEAFYIAWGVAQTPAYAGLPWGMFTGFAIERLMVVFAHGWMTALAAYGLSRGGKRALLWLLAAMGLHALINAGAILYHLNLIAAAASQISLFVGMVISMKVFERLHRVHRVPAESNETVYF